MNSKYRKIMSDFISWIGKPSSAFAIISSFILIIILFSWNIHENFKIQILSRYRENLLIVARSISKNFEQEIDTHLKSLELIGSNPFLQEGLLKTMPEREWDLSQYQIKGYYERHRNDFDAVYLLNAEGYFIYRYPPYPADKSYPRDFSDKEGVARVMALNKPFLTNIFRNNYGSYSMSIIHPVFKGKIFIGMIRAMININNISRQFFQPSKVGSRGNFLLFDDSGVIYYHPDKTLIGKSIKDIIDPSSYENNPGSQKLTGELLKGTEGSGIHTMRDLFHEKSLVAWTYISKDPVVSGIAKIRINMIDPGNPGRYQNDKDALIITYMLDKLIPKKEILFSLPDLNEKIKALLNNYRQISEIEIYDSISMKSGLMKVLHKKCENDYCWDVYNDRYSIAGHNALKVNEIEGPVVAINEKEMLITAPIHASTEIWPLAVTLPYDDIIGPINKNAYKMVFLSSLIILIIIIGSLVFSYSKNQKSKIEDQAKHLAEINLKTEELRKSDLLKNELEEKLVRSEKMQALGLLAGEVAHDLNNVLSGIVSYPDFLLSKMAPGDPMRDDLEIIRKSGDKAAAIVQDLLTLTRRGVIKTSILNLNSIIHDYLSSPEYKNIRESCPDIILKLNLYPVLDNITGSHVHVSKCIMNIVSNSYEAIYTGGEISISTSNHILTGRESCFGQSLKGSYAAVSVMDTGKGIEPDDLKKIFEPFYTRKTMGRSGTGLGMTVVWGVLLDHKGHIDIESSPGAGTSITLYFPVTSEEIADIKKVNPVDIQGRGERILVVDDIESQRKIGSIILSSLGYWVDTAASGEEAVEYVKKVRPDLILLDMIIAGGIDGLEAYKRILDINPLQKVIIVSGFSETERVARAQELGAGEYIKKPYSMEKLGLAVRNELKKK